MPLLKCLDPIHVAICVHHNIIIDSLHFFHALLILLHCVTPCYISWLILTNIPFEMPLEVLPHMSDTEHLFGLMKHFTNYINETMQHKQKTIVQQ